MEVSGREIRYKNEFKARDSSSNKGKSTRAPDYQLTRDMVRK